MTAPSLVHLTLTTGHVRDSARAEVGDDIIAMLRPVVTAGGGMLRGLRITLAAHIQIHGRPSPEDRDATLPGYRHGDEVWTPVCFPLTPDRYTSRAYGEHVIRLALKRQDGLQHVPALRRKFGIA